MVSVRVAKLMSNKNAPSPLYPSLIIAVMTMVLLVMTPDLATAHQSSDPGEDSESTAIERAFQTEVLPLLKKYMKFIIFSLKQEKLAIRKNLEIRKILLKL